MFDIGDLLGAGDFPLNGHRSAEALLIQLGHQHREINSAFAQRFLPASEQGMLGIYPRTTQLKLCVLVEVVWGNYSSCAGAAARPGRPVRGQTEPA